MLTTSAINDDRYTIPGEDLAGCEGLEVLKAWMFIDLIDSTSWYVSRESEESFPILRGCLERMGQLVTAHHGSVVKLTGDGLHACFDRPLDALECAVEYNGNLLTSRVGCPTARIGLSFGPSVQCEICEHVDFYGLSVTLAARLSDFGEQGAIIMSGRFRWEDDVRMRLAGVPVEVTSRKLKGFPDSVTVYQLDPREMLPAKRGGREPGRHGLQLLLNGELIMR